MNPGLRFLLTHTFRGRLRWAGRRMRTLKGAVGILGTTLFLLLMAASQLWVTLDPDMRVMSAVDPAALRVNVPAMVLAFAVVAAFSGRALYFSPAEVDFLFPAPIGRRELLLYQILSRLGLQLLSAAWASLFMVRYAPRPLFGVAAVFLSFCFIYVAAQALGVAAAAAEAWMSVAARRMVRLLLIGGALVVVVSGLAAGDGLSPRQRLHALAMSPVVRALDVVTRPFGELFAARGAAAALGWAAACIGVTAAVAGVVLASDAAYTERSLRISARAHERLRRMRSGGSVYAAAAPVRLRIPVPRLRLLGATGALAWRQLAELARTPRTLIMPLLMGGVWVGVVAMSARGGGDTMELATTLVAICVVLPTIFTAQFAFDFRRDLDRMALLRSLPLSPTKVAAGQILAVALVMVAFEYLMVGTAVALTGGIPRIWLLGIAVGAPPFAWIAAAADNGLFLVMPYRIVPGSQNYQFMGKTLLSMLLKMLILFLCCGVAGAVGVVVRILTSSWPGTLAAGMAVLVALCIPLTWLVGRAFRAFDITLDTAV